MKTNYTLFRKMASYSIVIYLFCTVAFAQEKITICHLPPGNPENMHTITISQNALQAHLAHGDYEGECVLANWAAMDFYGKSIYLKMYDSQGANLINEGPSSFSSSQEMIIQVTQSRQLQKGLYILCVTYNEKLYCNKIIVE
jgi:hypothetical protein